MTKFKHKESRAHQLYARIPFGFIVLAALFSFALLASVDARAGEPVDAYGMIWDSEILADHAEARENASNAVALLRQMVEAGTTDPEIIMAQARLVLNLSALVTKLYTVTETVNELAKDPSFMCDEAPVNPNPSIIYRPA